jgi:hypothetical protein
VTGELAELIELFRTHKITAAEAAALRISFTFGNLAIDKPYITRELIKQEAANAAEVASES